MPGELTAAAATDPYRILVIDDMPAIHEDYRKVLCGTGTAGAADALAEMESVLFGGNDAGGNPGLVAAACPVPPRFELDSALQGEEGVAKLAAAQRAGRPYAMAFVDMRMPPGWDGVRTISELWKVDPGLQVVICTAFTDYTPEQISGRLGVDGRMLILRKPFDGHEVRQLAMTLCEKWETNRRRSDLEKIVEARTAELKKVALHDALTGLPNRMLFNDRLTRALARAKRFPDFKFAVLFIDADGFKVVNDSLGHEAGDLLLLQIAERLNTSLRELDTVGRADEHAPGTPVPPTAQPYMAARLGGDEFTVILENIHADADAARVAQRLLAEAAKPYLINGQTVHSTFSIGITTSSVGYERAEDMLRDADTAMYHAKRQGRARFSMFDRDMHAAAVARLTLEADLRAAIANRQVTLHYQPIVEVRTRRLIGFEALARWDHPTRGSVPPGEFIPLAEETGAIIPLGYQVLETACRQLAAWQRQWPGMAHLTMSVNVSRKQFAAPAFVDRVRAIVAESGISPRNLKLEITENAVMDDQRLALEVLRQIQAMNIQLHVDDFGTGYSSLSCLQHFPLNGLKIDKDFVSGLTKNADQAAIIWTIIDLAHRLKIPLVAEGVETVEQTRTLESMGCDQAQGYLFARPMDAEAATRFIGSQPVVPAAA